MSPSKAWERARCLGAPSLHVDHWTGSDPIAGSAIVGMVHQLDTEVADGVSGDHCFGAASSRSSHFLPTCTFGPGTFQRLVQQHCGGRLNHKSCVAIEAHLSA